MGCRPTTLEWNLLHDHPDLHVLTFFLSMQGILPPALALNSRIVQYMVSGDIGWRKQHGKSTGIAGNWHHAANHSQYRVPTSIGSKPKKL